MKRIVCINLILSTAILIACSYCHTPRDPDAIGADGWMFEGWTCAPGTTEALNGKSPAESCDGLYKDKQEYLYMNFSARASNRAMRMNDTTIKQITCRDAGLIQMKGDGLSRIIRKYLEREYLACDICCDSRSPFVHLLRPKIKSVGVYDCCSLNPHTGRCADPAYGDPETWDECRCVGYLHYPGGREAFEADVKETSGDFYWID